MVCAAGAQIAFGAPRRLWHILGLMSCLRRRFLWFFRLAAFAALVAMLVPTATGLVHQPAAVQSLSRICGVDQPSSHGDPQKAPVHKVPFCPICQSLHLLGGGFVPPDAVTVIAVVSGVGAEVSADSAFLLTPLLPPQARPRAPPVLV